MNRAISSSLDDGSTAAAIDTAALFARCLGNVSFALSLLNELEADGERRVDELARHAADGNCIEAAEAAHALRGAAGIIAAEPLRELAAQIESAGRSRDLERVAPLVEELRGEMARCLADVVRIRAHAGRADK